ncbi:MAG: M15 family metallopeptidase, partial [Acidimicrobiia bacterium]|nr:M15 family metallopeptidase [Acidimicrobiia bacterium]
MRALSSGGIGSSPNPRAMLGASARVKKIDRSAASNLREQPPMLLPRARTSPCSGADATRADAAGTTSSMPSFSRTASAVVIVVLAIGQAAPSSAADNPSAQRQQVEAQRAQAAAQLNVLRASQTQIQKALDDLDGNVRGQEAAVAAASQAADVAAAELDQARQQEAEKQAEVASLRSQASEVALDAYMGTTASATLTSLAGGNLNDLSRRDAYLSIAVGNATDTLDQLRAAQQDLLARRRAAQRARDQTATRRAAVQSRLAALSQAQVQQMKFAGEIENKIAVTSSMSDQLAQQSSQLAAQIAAQQAAASPATVTTGSLCLTTVRTITVNCSIAAALDKMLGAAEAAGYVLTGQGYRSPEQQIAVRRANCGSSAYDIYQMPPSDCHPPAALPGTSMHEQGLAVDFIWNGSLISSHSDPAWQWLSANAATYGFYNLPVEPWHW